MAELTRFGTFGLQGISEEELYQEALSLPLEVKIEKALLLIREYEPMALQLSPEGYYVAFSGGKDSVVMERLFKMAGVKYISWYSNVTIDPPELVRFIKQKYPEVRWNNPEKHLCVAISDKSVGPPTRKIRWCCEIYKEQGGSGLFRAVGVRAAESVRRKGLWSLISRDTRDKNQLRMAPILYWTDNNVWNFIKKNNIPYCDLYDQGFSRLGCVGCPMGNRKKEFARWPKYEKLWKKGVYVWWEKYRVLLRKDGQPYFAAKFKTFDEFWDWWMEEENVNDTTDPDCQNWFW